MPALRLEYIVRVMPFPCEGVLEPHCRSTLMSATLRHGTSYESCVSWPQPRPESAESGQDQPANTATGSEMVVVAWIVSLVPGRISTRFGGVLTTPRRTADGRSENCSESSMQRERTVQSLSSSPASVSITTSSYRKRWLLSAWRTPRRTASRAAAVSEGSVSAPRSGNFPACRRRRAAPVSRGGPHAGEVYLQRDAWSITVSALHRRAAL